MPNKKVKQPIQCYSKSSKNSCPEKIACRDFINVGLVIIVFLRRDFINVGQVLNVKST